MGYDQETVVVAIRLMSEVPWTTTLVEQGHGSLVLVRKVHTEYLSTALAAGGTIHTMFSLLPSEADPGAASASTQRGVRLLGEAAASISRAPGLRLGVFCRCPELLGSGGEGRC